MRDDRRVLGDGRRRRLGRDRRGGAAMSVREDLSSRSSARLWDLSSFAIAFICFGGWSVTVSHDATTIGCQCHPNEKWLAWAPNDVAEMHDDAADWWRLHGECVKAVIRHVMAWHAQANPTATEVLR